MFFWKKKVHGEVLLLCPRCKKYMEKIKKKDVIIDVCRKCNGMWLDSGEADKLAKIYQAQMKQKVKKNGKK